MRLVGAASCCAREAAYRVSASVGQVLHIDTAGILRGFAAASMKGRPSTRLTLAGPLTSPDRLCATTAATFSAKSYIGAVTVNTAELVADCCSGSARPRFRATFLSAEPRCLPFDFASDLGGHFRAHSDESDGVVDEAELDVLARWQAPLQVPAHAQLDQAVVALGRGCEDVRAEIRLILVRRRDGPDPADRSRRERAEAALARRGKDDAGAGVDLPVRDPLTGVLVVVVVPTRTWTFSSRKEAG
jgi:hypothetical protein